jgi:hypothetical protein
LPFSPHTHVSVRWRIPAPLPPLAPRTWISCHYCAGVPATAAHRRLCGRGCRGSSLQARALSASPCMAIPWPLPRAEAATAAVSAAAVVTPPLAPIPGLPHAWPPCHCMQPHALLASPAPLAERACDAQIRAAPPEPRIAGTPIATPARTSLRLLPPSRSLGCWAHNLWRSSA